MEVGEQRVTPLELFFDLVFVFAITQVTGYVTGKPTAAGFLEGVALLAVLWWAWTGYAWLQNSAATDEGRFRFILLAAMGATLIASLAVPTAFGADALVFAVAYAVLRLLHLGGSAWVTEIGWRRDLVLRLSAAALPATLLILIGAALGGTAEAVCFALALLVDYGGLLVAGTEGWEVEPGHFAERHSLIVIIALGESIVALGVGAGGLPLDAGVIVAALLGITGVAALWWIYFDVVVLVAERIFRTAEPARQVRIARDSYTYLHLPMVVGIILFAVGIKKTLGHVEDPLKSVPALALGGGMALYLLALSALKRRNVGSWNRPRLVAAAAALALWPVTTVVPALVALALASLVAVLLVAYEYRAYAEARDRIRHGPAAAVASAADAVPAQPVAP